MDQEDNAEVPAELTFSDIAKKPAPGLAGGPGVVRFVPGLPFSASRKATGSGSRRKANVNFRLLTRDLAVWVSRDLAVWVSFVFSI